MLRIAGTVFLLFAASVGQAQVPANKEPMDLAIDRGLEFLARMQDRNDGSWRAHGSKNVAVSSLSIMAFLSAGHVPGEGKYGQVIEKGVSWVMSRQQQNGLIAAGAGSEMYHHGIATLMLAEVAGMTDGPLAQEIRKKLEKAVALTLRAQVSRIGLHKGGWRYEVRGVDSDISVTGWQVMSLRAAKNLGCDVPAEKIDLAVQYIKSCYDPASGGFRYMPHAHVTTACTGTSILALELCGKEVHRSPEMLTRAGGFLLKCLPSWGQGHFYYALYYCSQASFQLGDNYWLIYRRHMHDTLFRAQKSNGCWEGGDSDAQAGGPSYSTAMAILR